MGKVYTEGHMVFRPDGTPRGSFHPIERLAWKSFLRDRRMTKVQAIEKGYTCRRVRVTVEEIEE
jgi:hypothetical protein